MKRREFCKGVALAPASAALLSIPQITKTASPAKAKFGSSQAGKAAGSKVVPDFAGNMLTSGY